MHFFYFSDKHFINPKDVNGTLAAEQFIFILHHPFVINCLDKFAYFNHCFLIQLV